MDSLRPDGLLGRVVLSGRARDIVTRTDGELVLGEGTLTVGVDFVGGRVVTDISADPSDPGLDALIGENAASGFRARLATAVPAERAALSLLHTMLDDVPVVTLVGGYALGAGGVVTPPKLAAKFAKPDLCSGWVSGGTIMAAIDGEEGVPTVTGPPAPDLRNPDDPNGWPAFGPLTAHAMRRARRLDITESPAGVLLSSHFRDSHVDDLGRESVIHEYTVTGLVNPDTWEILELEAQPRVLPWVECPGAAASAGRLIGSDLRGLREEVRRDFVGVGTCTHLNDQLRQLADTPALLAALREG
jgi:hypothetical protein